MDEQSSNIIDTTKLIEGQTYLVKHYKSISDKTSGKYTRRIFLGFEKRFKRLDCLIFTTRVTSVNLPTSELSIPHYLIKDIKPFNHG